MTTVAVRMPTRSPTPRSAQLDERYTAVDGVVHLSGVQALVRLLLDRRRRDEAAGLDTASFVSGYPGSPVASLDGELGRCSSLLAEHRAVHLPGVNEELAMTSVMGTQLLDLVPRPRHLGVVGMWYGKAPGVDRAGDALKHGNYVGASPHGGVIVVGGDDPACKSSTLPSDLRGAFHDALMPVLTPGNPQEVLALGQHAIELSRASGLWAGFRFSAVVGDGFGTVDVSGLSDPHPRLAFEGAYAHRPSLRGLPPAESLRMEEHIHETRLPVAREYGRAHGLNRITHDAPEAWLGLVAGGHTYYELMEALQTLGLTEPRLRAAGIRVVRIGMPYPLAPEDVRRFGKGLETLLVVEDKRPFVEQFVKDFLYGQASAPRVLGKLDADGKPLLPATGALGSDAIAAAIRRVVDGRVELEARRPSISVRSPLPMAPARQPYFCSGCPHSTGAQAREGGSPVGAGIGCHAMVMWMPPSLVGDVIGSTHMGCEGAQWLGVAPFTETSHFIQNVGDGTFFHSAHLAVRAAIAARANITFKLLYNDTVAMTGGQSITGSMPVPALVRLLLAEGVARVVVTTDDPRRYRRRNRLPRAVQVRPRDRLLEVQDELAEVPGVTVLVHDQACAAELRRLRKRGLVPDPATRVVVNPRVCEGCGDCQRASNCLSLQTVETEYGPKTKVDQGSCNKDLSCLVGDCPAFVTVEPAAARPPHARPEPPAVDEPAGSQTAVRIRLTGIGGTGVLTISQLVATAAMLDGRHVIGLDQIGLAQKGGPVVSDLHITETPLDGAPTAPAGALDAYVVLDPIVGLSAANLAACSPGRTVALVSTTRTVTGAMLHDGAAFPGQEAIREAVDARTASGGNVYLDAGALAQALFGDQVPVNVLMLGALYQRGLLPLQASSLERAIELNGTAVEVNLEAFRWGRACAADLDAVLRLIAPTDEQSPPSAPACDAAARAVGEPDWPDRDSLVTLVAGRADDLAAYQSWAYAERYLGEVAKVAAADAAHGDGSGRLTRAVAVNLHKLMAYKDEYEVARLQLDPAFGRYIAAEVGAPRRLRWHLHPPALRAMGMRRKLRVPVWAGLPAYGALVRMRKLRGTPFDPFGYHHIRRLERSLITEYVDVLDVVRTSLPLGAYGDAVDIAGLPDLVRGYEHVKVASVEKYREQLHDRRARLTVQEALSA